MSNKLTNLIDIKIPDVGDFDSIEVIEILVSKGDSVKIEESLITLETDKASMDIPSPETGEINSLNVKVGDLVKKDDIIGNIKIIGSTKSKIKNQPLKESENSQKTTEAITNSQPLNHQPPKHPSTTRTLPVIDEKQFTTAHASPSVRKFARELGVNLVEVNGSGTKSRILHEDIKGFVKAILSGASFSGSSLPKVPTVDYAKYGEIVIEPLSRIQKISGPRLQASWINLPHVTQHDECDLSELLEERLRQKNLAKNKKLKISPLAFIIKACALTLENFPRVNASLTDDGKSLVLKKYINIGFAADTKNGLVVPVIKDVDKKGFFEIAAELGEISARARDGALTAKDLQGGTFSISSLGGIGGSFFTPIVNAPEVAILGVGRHKMQPVWNGKDFVPRLMLPLSVSYEQPLPCPIRFYLPHKLLILKR